MALAHFISNYDVRRPRRVLYGWTRIQHTWLICLALSLLVVVALYVMVVVDYIKDDNLGYDYARLAYIAWESYAEGAPFLFASLAAALAVTRLYIVEFNQTHIRRRWLWLVKTWPWTDVLHLGDWSGAAKIELKGGQTITVSRYARGYFELMDEIRRRGVRVRDHVTVEER